MTDPLVFSWRWQDVLFVFVLLLAVQGFTLALVWLWGVIARWLERD